MTCSCVSVSLCSRIKDRKCTDVEGGRETEDKDRRQRELIEGKQVRRDTKASLMDGIALCETVMVFLPYWLLFYKKKMSSYSTMLQTD